MSCLARARILRHRLLCTTLAVGLGWALPAGAQQPPPTPPERGCPESSPKAEADSDCKDTNGDSQPDGQRPKKNSGRIFWLLPNFTTVEGAAELPPITTKEAFAIAAQDSFDPYVFPYVGLVVLVNRATNQTPSWNHGASGLVKLYGAAFADNAIGNVMVQAVVPWAARQDPRYFQLGRGSVLHRAGYALSRTVVTRSKDGNRQFNVSEIGGNAIASAIGNAYYPAGDRSGSAFLARWGSQILWDAASFELKEFWPDIRRRLQK
jgi:hypothetical protein